MCYSLHPLAIRGRNIFGGSSGIVQEPAKTPQRVVSVGCLVCHCFADATVRVTAPQVRLGECPAGFNQPYLIKSDGDWLSKVEWEFLSQLVAVFSLHTNHTAASHTQTSRDELQQWRVRRESLRFKVYRGYNCLIIRVINHWRLITHW